MGAFLPSDTYFSFSYPNQFVLSGGDIGYSQDWSAATNNLGLLLTVVNIPRTFFTENTNFGEAKFTVGTSADPDAVKNCLEYNYGETGTTSEVMIGSRQFTKINFSLLKLMVEPGGIEPPTF